MPYLRNKLPPNMKNDLWIDFIDSIEEESLLQKAEIAKKINWYNVYEMDRERLLELSDLLGVPFDVSVKDDLDFLRSEILSIAFRVKWKATTKAYLSLFKALDREGLIYIYYYDSVNIIRNTKSLLDSIEDDTTCPVKHLSEMNFTGFIREQLLLDTGWKLDDEFRLDTFTSFLNTKHLSLEFFIDRVIEKDGREYLMVPEYYSYVHTNMEKLRKTTEVIHLGSQCGCITENTKTYDFNGYSYTCPVLKMNTVTTDFFDAITAVTGIENMVFGIGSHTNLPSEGGAGVQPTELAEKIARMPILSTERYENESWMGVNSQYLGNLVNDVVIGTGDGVSSTFTNILPYAPIKPGNIKITLTSSGVEHEVEDDGFGNITGTNAQGIIDYETGEITIETDIYYPTTETAGVGDGTETIFNYNSLFGYAKVNSIIFKYTIGGTKYVAVDDGIGNISGTACAGTVNYETGEFSFTFSVPPSDNTNLDLQYAYRKTTIPDLDSIVVTAYYFMGESVEITEAGLIDSDRNLLAYSTFPPIKFKDYKNHLNMFFLIKK